MPETRYRDAVVIGAGQGGGPLAAALAESGRDTLLVEREHVGGTCVNDGCTPTKTMVASARVAHLARRAGDYGVRGGGAVTVDLARVRERKRRIVESFREGSRSSLVATEGLELRGATARFVGPRTLDLLAPDGSLERVEAGEVFLNVGARPRMPELSGLPEVPFLTSTSIMELAEVPEGLLVLGGGYVGVEFAQMFRRFGSEVTVVQRASALLPREDRDVSDAVREIFTEDGIDVILDVEATSVRRRGDALLLSLASGGPAGGTAELGGSHLLVAVGRAPNTEGLGLETAGVATDERGHIRVNDRLETTADNVWALGDVKGGPAFTHVSYDDFRVLRANLLEGGDRSIADRIVPYTVFTDPQLGRVGLTEREAREAGRRVRVAKLPMDRVARALETDETRGFMKAVVDADDGTILGAAVLGAEGGETMSVLEMAMLGGIGWERVRDATLAHPTFAESLNNLFMTLDTEDT